MSSFRPTSEGRTTEFLPLSYAQPTPAVFAATVAIEHSESQAMGEDELGDAAAGTTLTADELAEIEAAAFARGAESIGPRIERIEAAYHTLDEAGKALAVAAATLPVANREQLVELASQIATRWVGAELQLDSALFRQALEHALDASDAQEPARLHLHPEDRTILLAETEADSAASSLAGRLASAQIELCADETLARAEFRVELTMSMIDGRRESIRLRLEEALAAALAAPLPEVES